MLISIQFCISYSWSTSQRVKPHKYVKTFMLLYNLKYCHPKACKHENVK